MKKSERRFIYARLATFACIAFLCGCGTNTNNPRTHPVSGVVTLKGVPIADADIVFVPESKEAQAAFGKSDASGAYRLMTFEPGDGAVSGSYKVKVSKMDVSKTAGSGKVFASSEEEAEFYNPKDGDPIKVQKNLIPQKFTDHNTSGLKHSVGNSASTFDIKL